ncbi:small oligopeptide transporter [Phlegmacium glaucopus]|nr:small oligopeptide transporter [Phlegmacium glaucopus]
MGGPELKEITPLDYGLRDAVKSLENQVQSDSSSTFSGHGSETSSGFDPNYDSASMLEDDSPYLEVRSAVANFDDPEMPASTIRAWIMGIIWAILISGMNQFFYFRYPSVSIGNLVAQLLAFPLGRAWVKLCPAVSILGMQLNPGPFTIKEHVLVTIMASVGAQSAYAVDIVAVQRFIYHQTWSFLYNWMLVMSTQLIGFSIGGVARRFLVAPPSMIWPNSLVSCALFNTLHSQTYAGIGTHDGPTREQYFLYAFIAAVIWSIVPGYLFQALSVFSWVCWIAPNNVKINQIFGYHSGLGFSLITLDWSQIAFIGSPLATPWWAEANVVLGFIFFYWFLTPLFYYLDVWHTQYLPISSLSAYDNRGFTYNVTRVLNPDNTLNLTAYREYSPLYLPIAFAMSYGLSFLSITATLTHAAIHFYKPIRLHFRRSMREQPDIHARLMSRYPQVPDYYYACIFVITFIFACVCIQLWPSGMTIWALVIALLLALVYVIPIGMIQAVTNRQVALNVITELVVGFMIPGKPNAMMMYTFGYITMSQAMQFTADFKLGHNIAKVPPRPMFWCQIVATVVAGTVQLGVQSWMFTNIPCLCTPNQKDNFSCASTQVFGTASIIWGVIGPGLHFTKGQIYYGLTFFFLIGAACPVILWLITRRYPNTILNYLKLIFSGVDLIPPATAVNYVPWAIIGFIFQYVVRRKHFSYWAKYNYVLSAALDAGTAIGFILIYFCLQYPMNGSIGLHTIQSWWGNQVFMETLDWNNTALRQLDPGATFGCDSLSFFVLFDISVSDFCKNHRATKW